MRGPLLPVLLLAVLPGLFFTWQLGLWRRRWARWGLLAAAGAALAWSLPTEGLDLVHLKYLTLFLCAAAVLLSLWAHPRLGLPLRRYRAALGVLALSSLVVYLNFFSFHGARTFVHLHDTAHYYLGAKYFTELGYEGLYTAMLRAEAEAYDSHFMTLEARDLTTNELVHIRELLRRSDEVKAGFTPERWRDFVRDVAMFRDALGPQYAGLFVDHGFNPTPLWPALGGALANLVPAGSRAGILALALIDPVLLAAAFAAVVWAFGWDAALLAAIHFCVVFGAGFGWTGGAFLRYLWLASLVVALASLRKERHAFAGGLVALAAALRVFPAFFALPILVKAAHSLWRRRRIEPAQRSFLLGLLGVGAGLFLLSGLQGRGLGAWQEFQAHMGVHVDTISPNLVGLTGALAYHETPAKITAEEMRAERERRARIHRLQLATFFLAAVVAVVLLAPMLDDIAALLLAVPLLLTGLDLAGYYYVLLVLLVIANWNRPLRLAAFFGLELCCYALLLFEDREHILYIYRSVLLLYLLVAFQIQPLRDRLAQLWKGRATVPSAASPAVTVSR